MKIPNLAAMPVARFPAPGAGPPQAAPLPGAGPSMPVDRLRAHTVHLAHSQAPHLLSPGNLQSSGESSPDTPPQAPPRPQVSQKEARRSPGHRRHTLASRVGGRPRRRPRHPMCVHAARASRSESCSVGAVVILCPGPSRAPRGAEQHPWPPPAGCQEQPSLPGRDKQRCLQTLPNGHWGQCHPWSSTTGPDRSLLRAQPRPTKSLPLSDAVWFGALTLQSPP